MDKITLLWLVSLLIPPLPAQQNGPLIGPLCVNGKGKVYSCYLVDVVPGKPPVIVNGPKPHGVVVRRFTWADTKRRIARDAGWVGKVVVVVVSSPLP